MKINELSKLTGVNTETIRMYRQRKLLFPRKLPNGYYDYTTEDLVRLLNIRCLRGAGLGLDTIAYTYTSENRQEILERLNREKGELEQQIQKLRFRKSLLELTQREYQQSESSGEPVTEYRIDLPGYGICLDDARKDPQIVDCLKNTELFAQNIMIDLPGLDPENLPEYIPYAHALACYAYILENSGVELPKSARLLSPGIYLTLWLEPDADRRGIPRDQLMPLFRYAKTHGYRFTGECAGFLFCVNHLDDTGGFRYCFRARVEK